jgi:hypothetical protein
MDNTSKTRATVGGILFTGCMFIGLGSGIYFHHTAVGLFIGMGVGFVAMGIAWALVKKD